MNELPGVGVVLNSLPHSHTLLSTAIAFSPPVMTLPVRLPTAGVPHVEASRVGRVKSMVCIVFRTLDIAGISSLRL